MLRDDVGVVRVHHGAASGFIRIVAGRRRSVPFTAFSTPHTVHGDGTRNEQAMSTACALLHAALSAGVPEGAGR